MVQVMPSPEGAAAATAGVAAARPMRLTMTLYELLSAIQDVVGVDGDELVVTTVQHLFQSGRLSWSRERRVRLCESP